MKWMSTAQQLPPVGSRVIFWTYKPTNNGYSGLLPEVFVGFLSSKGHIVRADRNHIYVDANKVNWLWARIELPYETLLSHSTV